MPTSFPTQEIKKPTLFLIKVTKPINFIAWHCRILFSTYLYITAQMSKKSRKISKIFKKIIEKLQKSPILYIFCYFFSGRTLCRSTTRFFAPIGRHGFFYGLSGVSLFCRTRSAMEGASVVYRKNTRRGFCSHSPSNPA